MDEQKYPSNSYFKNEDSKTAPIAHATLKQREKNLKERVVGEIFADDMREVGKHIILGVIVPKIKDVLFDSICAFFKFDGRSVSRGQKSSSTYGSYGTYEDYSSYSSMPRTKQYAKPADYVEEVIFQSADQAWDVLEEMQRRIRRYEYVSIKEYYEMSGVKSDWAKDGMGWINLDDAAVIQRGRCDFCIDLPKPVARPK